ncbi:MAG: DUF2812 domain-containing protein [Turicibacter sp.]|nr:DUF2812 domain-containing protein [Turicibacter sp.]
MYKYRLKMAAVSDTKNEERYLEKMAADGLMLDKFGFIDRFKETNPSEKKFFIDLIEDLKFSDLFSKNENPEMIIMRQKWAAAGWEFMGKSGMARVFCADKNTPLPDFATEHDQVYKSGKCCLKYEIVSYAVALISALLSSFALLDFGIRVFLENAVFFWAVSGVLFGFGILWQLGFSLAWYVRVRLAFNRGLPLPKFEEIWAKLRNMVFYVIMLAFLICVFLAINGRFWLFEQHENIVFNHAEHNAIQLHDFGIYGEPESMFTVVSSSLFVREIFHHNEVNFGFEPATVMTYTYRINSGFVANMIYNHFARGLALFGENPPVSIIYLENSESWGANNGIIAWIDEDFRMGDFRMLLRRENVVVAMFVSMEQADFDGVQTAALRVMSELE